MARRERSIEHLMECLGRLPGVGPKTARLLWDNFPSTEAMADAALEDLLQLPGLGEKKARALHEELQQLRRD